MKKFTFITVAALAAALVASCAKTQTYDQQDPLPSETASYGNVSIRLSLPGNATKARTEDYELEQISSVQVFIFDRATKARETDKYETVYPVAGGSYSTSFTVRTGEKIVWAVVNAPRLHDVETEDDLKQKISPLEQNAIDKLVMTGFNDTVNVKETNANTPGSGVGQKDYVEAVDIDVYRLGARITLQSIMIDFTDTELQYGRFTLTGLYLKNVVGKVCMDGSSASEDLDLGESTCWYNLFNQTAVSAAPEAVRHLTADMPISQLCETDGSVTYLAGDPEEDNDTGYSWYVYPNPSTAADDESDGQPVRTRLVVKGHLNGTSLGGELDEDTYYVFTIPGPIERNYIYNISRLTITMKGKPNDNDDTLTTAGKVEATVLVQDWEGAEDLSYDI